MNDRVSLTDAEIAEGVVLELEDSITLVLHHASAEGDEGGDDLGLVGHSDAIRQLRMRVRRVGPHDVTVLLRGESGSGKELVARAIHDLSARARAVVHQREHGSGAGHDRRVVFVRPHQGCVHRCDQVVGWLLWKSRPRHALS